jgi:hypothetical protein
MLDIDGGRWRVAESGVSQQRRIEEHFMINSHKVKLGLENKVKFHENQKGHLKEKINVEEG